MKYGVRLVVFMANTFIKEVDLYEPVQQYFHQLGYDVQAEVNDCDVVAMKDEQIIVIELKLNLNITLLMQAVNRQKLTEHVYVAIKRPKMSLRRKRWRDLVHLTRRLELGLMLVTFEGKLPSVKVIHEPGPFDRHKSYQLHKKKRESLIKEVSDRRSNVNVGGSYQVSTITAYKEKSIQIAFYLDKLGPMSAKQLEKLNTGERTYGILYNNYYNWFERIDRGIYDVTEKGRKQYKTYEEIVSLYKKSELNKSFYNEK